LTFSDGTLQERKASKIYLRASEKTAGDSLMGLGAVELKTALLG